MPRISFQSVVSFVTGLCCAAVAHAGVDYAREVKPLLRNHCYACHGAFKQQSGLRLDTGRSIRKGGDSGPAVVAGNPDESLLIQAVTGTAGFRMPPEDQGNPLTPEQIEVLKTWIREGAESPEDELPQQDPATYWSYVPIERPLLPEVANAAWVRMPIDAFIAAGHEQHGLTPRPEADRSTWLRRVYLDLIGLPPTRAELHAFLADDSADADEKVVDDLLNRPQYGERWGRHWMDVWRYSDWYGSRGGNEIRYSQRHIWRWRDWIVDSLNSDTGYDRMVLEMLAGDELAPTDPDVLRATGFLGRNWYKFDRNVWMFDTVEQTAQAFLGLTLRCARCHDHKYDPIAQEDYYRFRAFFEPHNVRTDRLDASTGTQKDATLGEVLNDGVARVYDKELDAPTYVFQRGDNRYPDKDHPLTAAVPPALGGDAVEMTPVSLPVEAYYPALRSDLLEGTLAQARERIAAADRQTEAARQAAETARQKTEELRTALAAAAQTETIKPEPFLHDDFARLRDDVWQTVSGDWAYTDGRLVEKQVGYFATIVTKQNHPRDFRAKVRYRTLPPGTYRSVGFSFDYVDQGNSQDVYTSTGDAAQSVQAFHRTGGQQVYPPAGIVRTPIRLGEETTVEVEVRGSQLTIRLNGEHKLDYVLPLERRDGKFALWVHEGSAEFLELEIAPLVVSLADLERSEREAAQAVAMREQQRKTAEAELDALTARIAAEKAKYFGEAENEAMLRAVAASKAEKSIAVAKAKETLLAAEQHLELIRLGVDPSAPPSAAQTESEQKVAAAKEAMAQAGQAVAAADGTYSPLGEIFPSTSTGRRSALARWIASPHNPRTARVAVNQIWLRHFGEALVPTVDNYGLNGAAPSHPELLNWLAAELIAGGWRMKPLHRLIVISATYRLQSTEGQGTRAEGQGSRVKGQESEAAALDSQPLTLDPSPLDPPPLDPTNRYLWHANSRRMEAELVRDSVLYVAGSLDLARGGPEIPETEGLTSFRRSLYFRNTPNEKMKLLELFDMADPNQCYRRRESVVPQQALALMNSGLALDQSRLLAEKLTAECGPVGDGQADAAFIVAAYETVLSRAPREVEQAACAKFLREHAALVERGESTPFAAGGQSQRAASTDPHQRARENLVQVLFSHNEFVTVR
jgi:hypothetical protein